MEEGTDLCHYGLVSHICSVERQAEDPGGYGAGNGEATAVSL